jgi:phosphoribosylanthranilate isomerase
MRDESTAVKICGVTNQHDALMCAASGVEMIGLNFARESQRRVSREAAADFIAAVRAAYAAVKFIGVFVNQPLQMVTSIADELRLDAIQSHRDEPSEYARVS